MGERVTYTPLGLYRSIHHNNSPHWFGSSQFKILGPEAQSPLLHDVHDRYV